MSIKVIYHPRDTSYFRTKYFPMKQEIDINVAAMKACDGAEYDVALRIFAVRFRN